MVYTAHTSLGIVIGSSAVVQCAATVHCAATHTRKKSKAKKKKRKGKEIFLLPLGDCSQNTVSVDCIIECFGGTLYDRSEAVQSILTAPNKDERRTTKMNKTCNRVSYCLNLTVTIWPIHLRSQKFNVSPPLSPFLIPPSRPATACGHINPPIPPAHLQTRGARPSPTRRITLRSQNQKRLAALVRQK